jgi:hypothetical protein
MEGTSRKTSIKLSHSQPICTILQQYARVSMRLGMTSKTRMNTGESAVAAHLCSVLHKPFISLGSWRSTAELLPLTDSFH